MTGLEARELELIPPPPSSLRCSTSISSPPASMTYSPPHSSPSSSTTTPPKSRPPLSFVLFAAVLSLPLINIQFDSLELNLPLRNTFNLFLLAVAAIFLLDLVAINRVWKPATRSKVLELGWVCWAVQGWAFLGAGGELLDMTMRQADWPDRSRIPVDAVLLVLSIPTWVAGQICEYTDGPGCPTSTSSASQAAHGPIRQVLTARSLPLPPCRLCPPDFRRGGARQARGTETMASRLGVGRPR